jgi:RNA polymerase sigma factor for flagellar operon FliA
MQNTALASEANHQTRILDHYPMVRAMAYRIHQRLPRQVEVDDLISAGVLGLIAACQRYDESRSVPFDTYARHRVRGAIVDALRAMDWVPRSVRRKADYIESTRLTLRRHSGRRPTRTEMAGAMEITPEKYDNMVTDAEIRTLFSLDQPLNDDNPTPLVEQLANDSDFVADQEADQLKARIIEAIQHLPERERTTIAMYYLRERSLKEIGTVLGVTESRACQLRSQGVKRLRYRLHNVIH